MQCTKELHFEPFRHQTSNLVSYSWKHWKLSHFEVQTEYSLNMTSPFEDAFFHIYPKITLPEIARLFELLDLNKITISKESFLAKYNLRWSEDLEKVLKKTLKTPLEFQNWISEKDLGLNDLKPLLLCQEVPQILVDSILKWKVNRYFGSRILEYTLMDYTPEIENTLKNSTSAEVAYHDLKKLRFPVTSAQDQTLEDSIQKFPWPAHIQAKWVRKGDRSGVQVEFFSTDSKDLEKKISSLYVLKERFQDLWK